MKDIKVNKTVCTDDEVISYVSKELQNFAEIYSREVVADKAIEIITSLVKDNCVQLTTIKIE